MFRNLFILTAIIAAVLIGTRVSLQNGSFLRFLDTHPDPRWVPAVEYYVGQGYYMFRDLERAATYFIRVPERYPNSSQADDAYFAYVQCLDDDIRLSRQELIAEYEKYLQRFPKGKNAAIVQFRLDDYRTR